MNTRHADIRMQQRGIPPLIKDWLLLYGQEAYDHRGGVIRYFDKKSLKRLRCEIGSRPVCRMAEFMDAYLVEREGAVITVGHRFKRVFRP